GPRVARTACGSSYEVVGSWCGSRMHLFDERQRRRVDTHSMNANEPSESTKIIEFRRGRGIYRNLRMALIAKDSERFGRADKTALSDLASLHSVGPSRMANLPEDKIPKTREALSGIMSWGGSPIESVANPRPALAGLD